ncbi:MAG: murein biosynthesis integral membrane protein MurJ [Symbiobacteriia bacterium]
MNRSAIARATILVTLLTIGSKLLGFVRDQGIALYFGASGQTDAYVVAMALPNIISALVVSAVGTAFLPMFTERLTKDDEEGAWALSDSVFSLVGGLGLLIVILGVTAAPWLVRLMAPGFTGATFAQAVTATRVIFPGALFVVLAAPVKSVLNSRHRFGAPVAGSIVQNVAILAGLVLFVGLGQMGIRGLALGLALGMALNLGIQLPTLWRGGFRYRPRLDLQSPVVRRTLGLAAPMMVSALFAQVSLLVDRGLASGLPAGSIAALSFADKLRQLPLGIFATAVATVIYPTLSEYAARGDRRGVSDAVGTGLRLVLLLTLPAAVGLAVLREPLVRALFQRGAFDAAATASTAIAVLYYAIGMIGLAANLVLTTAFFSLHDSVTPMATGAAGALVNIGLDYALVGPMGHAGIALASSTAALLSMALLWTMLRRRLANTDARTGQAAVKVLGASALMAAGVLLAQRVLAVTPVVRHSSLVQIAGAVGLGVLVYGVAVLALKVEEAGLLWRALGRRIAARHVVGHEAAR